MALSPSKHSDQPGHLPGLISLRCPHEESLGLYIATVSKNFKINLEGQNYVHFYVILSRNVKIFGIMASL